MQEPIQQLISREFEPAQRLKDYISSYWYYKIQTNIEKHFDILPDGYFDLVITLKENRIVDTRLTGIWTRTVSISYTENVEVFGVSFKPLAAGSLVNFNVKELLDDSLEVNLSAFNLNEDMLPNRLNGLSESFVHYLNAAFLKKMANHQVDKRLKKCFEMVDISDGNTAVKEMAHEVGISPRQLHKLVSNMIGIGIKDYAKIIRFKRSLQAVKNREINTLNYYDQSHYIREIKRYTGLTPTKIDLLKNDRFIQYYYFE